MDANTLIGSKISLISSSDGRYEGFLYEINNSNLSIILKDVRCFGTEDRPVANFVPPSDKVQAFVSFSGNSIKDLHVVIPAQAPAQATPSASAAPAPAPVKAPAAAPLPPAPVRAPAAAAVPPAPPAAPTSQPGHKWANGPPRIPQKPAAAPAAAPVQPAAVSQKAPQATQPTTTNPRALPGTGEALTHRKVLGGHGAAQGDVSTEFDFTKNNQQWDKDAEKAAAQLTAKKYNPEKSFFDELSSEGGRGMSLQEERKKNAETFDATALQDNQRRPNNYQRYNGPRTNAAPGVAPTHTSGYQHQGSSYHNQSAAAQTASTGTGRYNNTTNGGKGYSRPQQSGGEGKGYSSNGKGYSGKGKGKGNYQSTGYQASAGYQAGTTAQRPQRTESRVAWGPKSIAQKPVAV